MTVNECTIDVPVGYQRVGVARDIYEVDATCFSPVWAIHHGLELNARGTLEFGRKWTVTHVPTGMSLLADLPTEKSAAAIASLLVERGIEPDSDNSATVLEKLRSTGFLDLAVEVDRAIRARSAGSKILSLITSWRRKHGVRTASKAKSKAKTRSKKASPVNDPRFDEFFRLARALQNDNPAVLTPLTPKQAAAKHDCLC